MDSEKEKASGDMSSMHVYLVASYRSTYWIEIKYKAWLACSMGNLGNILISRQSLMEASFFLSLMNMANEC